MKYSSLKYIIDNGDVDLLDSYLDVEVERMINDTPEWAYRSTIVDDEIIDTDFIKPELLSIGEYSIVREKNDAYTISIAADYVDTVAIDDPAGKFGKVYVSVNVNGEIGEHGRGADMVINASVETII